MAAPRLLRSSSPFFHPKTKRFLCWNLFFYFAAASRARAYRPPEPPAHLSRRQALAHITPLAPGKPERPRIDLGKAGESPENSGRPGKTRGDSEKPGEPERPRRDLGKAGESPENSGKPGETRETRETRGNPGRLGKTRRNPGRLGRLGEIRIVSASLYSSPILARAKGITHAGDSFAANNSRMRSI